MKKMIFGIMFLVFLITGCAQSQPVADNKVVVETSESTENTVKTNEISSEELMERVETSSVEESVPLPANFPISYVPIIDGAQIAKAESKEEAGKMIYDVIQRVNIAKDDAYLYYNDIYLDAPNYEIISSKEGENITIARAKNGVDAELKFIAGEDGQSQVVMHVSVAN